MTQTNSDYDTLAKKVITAVGGSDNIEKVIHCVTRLRFYLEDDTIPNRDEVESIDVVLGVIESGGQYQVVVGPAVEDIYKSVTKQLSSSATATPVEKVKGPPTDDLSVLGKNKILV